MEVKEELVYNFLIDLKKKDIHPVEKARLIKLYMAEKNLGVRALARELGMPPNTLQGWINYEKLTPEDYDIMIKDGVPKTAIRDLVTEPKETQIQETNELDLNRCLMAANESLKPFIRKPKYNEKTIKLLINLSGTLNLIKIGINSKVK